MEEELARVTGYLRDNSVLRETLGIARGVDLAVRPLGQGEHNTNYWFAHPETGMKYVLRVNHVSQLGLDDQILYEYEALQVLEESHRAPSAYYVDNSKGLLDKGVLVMEFCEGAPLDYSSEGDLAQAARLLADVHSVAPSSKCRLHHPNNPLTEQYSECLALFSAYCDSEYRDPLVTSYIEGFFEATEHVLSTHLDENDCTHILNTEAIAAHFLIPEDGSIGHVIDWEKPIIGEVAQDIAYFLSPTTTIWDSDFIFTKQERDSFIRDYWIAVQGRFGKGGFDARFDAYVKSNCLRGITWSCAAWAEYQGPNRPLKNDKTLKRLGVYLSAEFLGFLGREYFS